MNEKEKRKIIEKEKLYFEQGEPTKKKKIKTALIVLVFILFIGVTCVTSYYVMKYIMLKKLNLNIDLDRDGWPELNIDTNGDKICDINCDNNNDKKPDYNIGYKKVLNAYFNLDTNRDKVADTNLINQKDANGVCILNCDVDGDNMPDTNLDLNNDGVADLNIDTNNDGICDINCDYKGSITPTINLDTNSDMKADLNIDTNNDGRPDLNITYGTDYTKAVFNIDTNNDGVADFNLINQMENNKCKLNCVLTEAKSSNAPAYNIDLDGDGKADVNIDITGKGMASLNVDFNGDGIPEINIDTNNDGKADVNIDTDGDSIPDINLDYNGDLIADFNLDTDNDRKPDKNLVNIKLNDNNDCDLNCNNGKGMPYYNIDLDNDGICDLYCDVDGDKQADFNLDTDGDYKADSNVVDMKNFTNNTTNDTIDIIEGTNEYIIKFLGKNDLNKDLLTAGYNKEKKIIVTNKTGKDLEFNIAWNELVNDYYYYNRPYFGVSLNGETLIDANVSQLPYANVRGEVFMSNMKIKNNESQEFTFKYKIKKSNYSEMDTGKIFYATQKIIIK